MFLPVLTWSGATTRNLAVRSLSNPLVPLQLKVYPLHSVPTSFSRRRESKGTHSPSFLAPLRHSGGSRNPEGKGNQVPFAKRKGTRASEARTHGMPCQLINPTSFSRRRESRGEGQPSPLPSLLIPKGEQKVVYQGDVGGLLAGRRGRRSCAIIPPARDRFVQENTAVMKGSRTDKREIASWRRRLAKFIPPPARDRTVRTQTARVSIPGADRLELARRR